MVGEIRLLRSAASKRERERARNVHRAPPSRFQVRLKEFRATLFAFRLTGEERGVTGLSKRAQSRIKAAVGAGPGGDQRQDGGARLHSPHHDSCLLMALLHVQFTAGGGAEGGGG